MRLIDVNKFKADYGMKDNCADCDKELRGRSKACEFDRVYTKMDFCGWLDDAPTVDAVPVVRCGECKYVGTDATCCLVCKREGMGLRPFHVYHDDYCSYGERKDGDGNDC